jgi:hypothetical protein
MKEMSEDVLFSITPYPLRMIKPVASRWVSKPQNTHSGVAPNFISAGRERRRHLDSLTGCEIQQIEEHEKELLATRAKMKRVIAVYEEYQQKLREREAEEAKWENEVDDMRKNSVVRGALTHINTSKGGLSQGSASASTPAAEPLSATCFWRTRHYEASHSTSRRRGRMEMDE